MNHASIVESHDRDRASCATHARDRHPAAGLDEAWLDGSNWARSLEEQVCDDARQDQADKDDGLDRAREFSCLRKPWRHRTEVRVAHNGMANAPRKTLFSTAFCQNPETSEYAVSGTNHVASDKAMMFQPTRLPAARSAFVA